MTTRDMLTMKTLCERHITHTTPKRELFVLAQALQNYGITLLEDDCALRVYIANRETESDPPYLPDPGEASGPVLAPRPTLAVQLTLW